MDVLSDTLRVVRLSGSVFLDARITAPWAFESGEAAQLAHYLRLPSDCVALFHVVADGRASFIVPGYAPAELTAGDAVLFPWCAPHVVRGVRSDALPPAPLVAVMPPLAPEGVLTMNDGRVGEPARLLCGYLHCDHRFNPLIGALPAVITVRRPRGARADASPAQQPRQMERAAPPPVVDITADDWLGASLSRMVEEAQEEGPGGSDMLGRLSEILFVEVIRRYMRALPSTQHGWLAGVRDPVVGQTLRLLHAHPERAWTVADLADAAAVSRSTLAQRFTTLIGETPMRYLATWRIQLAKVLLKGADLRLADIAARVGYESEAAFNRAFKRHTGCPPAAWRESDATTARVGAGE